MKRLTKRIDKKMPRRTFTESDMKQATRIEKLEMYMIQPSLYLSPRDLKYLDKCIDAFSISRQCLDRLEVIKKLQSIYSTLNYQNAVKLIDDTDRLFAPMVKRKKEITLAILMSRADVIYQAALQKEDLDSQINAVKLALDIEREQKDDRTEQLWDTLQLPDVVFTTNPKALTQAQDIDYEEE